MAFDFKLPDLGEGVAEGEIVEWKVAVGDTVAEDDALVEVMTDKATVEIPSPRAGTIESIAFEPGAVVPVGEVIVSIADGGADAPAEEKVEEAPAAEEQAAPVEEPKAAATPEPAPKAEAPAPTSTSSGSDAAVLATPATRKLARELGVSLEHVQGTGPRGRITKDDVRAFSSRGAAAGGGEAATGTTISRPEAPAISLPTSGDSSRETRTAYRGIRRKIGDAMIASAYTKPHFTLVEEMDMTEIVALRKQAKVSGEERGVKVTFLPFIMKALVAALKQHPTINGIFDEENAEIINYEDVHIGFALDTEGGLMVPVIRDANRKNVFELAGDLQRLSEAGRDGKITREELNGSTITITSAGSIGGLFATPIINYPELGILGVYKIEDRAVVRDGQIVVRKMTYMSITLDHRIVDGGEAARFMNTMKRLLESPTTLLLEG